jgi:hypothetical protein
MFQHKIRPTKTLIQLTLKETDNGTLPTQLIETLKTAIVNGETARFTSELKRYPHEEILPTHLFLLALKHKRLSISLQLLDAKNCPINDSNIALENFEGDEWLTFWTKTLPKVKRVGFNAIIRLLYTECDRDFISAFINKRDPRDDCMLSHFVIDQRELKQQASFILSLLIDGGMVLKSEALLNMFKSNNQSMLSLLRKKCQSNLKLSNLSAAWVLDYIPLNQSVLPPQSRSTDNVEVLNRLIEDKYTLLPLLEYLCERHDDDMVVFLLNKIQDQSQHDDLIIRILENSYYDPEAKNTWHYFLAKLHNKKSLPSAYVREYLRFQQPEEKAYLLALGVTTEPDAAELALQRINDADIQSLRQMNMLATNNHKKQYYYTLTEKHLLLPPDDFSYLLSIASEFDFFRTTIKPNIIRESNQNVINNLNALFTSGVSFGSLFRETIIDAFKIGDETCLTLFQSLFNRSYHPAFDIGSIYHPDSAISQQQLELLDTFHIKMDHWYARNESVYQHVINTALNQLAENFNYLDCRDTIYKLLKRMIDFDEKRREIGAQLYAHVLGENHIVPFLTMSSALYSISRKMPLQTFIDSILSCHDNYTWMIRYPNVDIRMAQGAVFDNISFYGFHQPTYTTLLEKLRPLCAENNLIHLKNYALKLSILFADVNAAIDYVKRFTTKQPVHDACLFNLPSNGIWDIPRWRGFIKRFNYSKNAMSLLAHAAIVEQILFPLHKGVLSPMIFDLIQNERGTDSLKQCYSDMIRKKMGVKKKVSSVEWEKLKLHFPADYQAFLVHMSTLKKPQAKDKIDAAMPLSSFIDFFVKRRDFDKFTQNVLVELIVQYLYPKVDKTQYAFALECTKYGVSKGAVEEATTLLKTGKKRFDYLPNISLSLDNLGYPDILFEKVPNDDPNAFILGKQTACCQSIDGHSRSCVLHGFQSIFGGFYRLKDKRGKVIAQSWAGVTQDGEICFDSIEHAHDSELIMPCYEALANKLLEANPLITRVVFGSGGNTPTTDKYRLQNKPSKGYSPIIGYQAIGYDSRGERYILADNSTQVHANLLSDAENLKKHIHITPGSDTYANPGHKTKEPSLSPFFRHAFFERFKPQKDMLMEHPQNPLFEEGKMNPDRNHEGELFLSFDCLKILFKQKILSKAVKQGTSYHLAHPYQVDNTILSDNDLIDFEDKLKKIHLNNNDNILMLAMEDVHAYAIYFEKRNNQYFCFIFDSEGTGQDTDYINIIAKTYPEAQITCSSAMLQYDYESCGVFAIKALMYFAKHGRDLPISFYSSPTKDLKTLPPALLKLSQQAIHFEDEQFSSHQEQALSLAKADTIVSHKKNLTLRGYLNKMHFKDNEKTYSIAALMKKYFYLARMDMSQVEAKEYQL